jgi:hypothetical protein
MIFDVGGPFDAQGFNLPAVKNAAPAANNRNKHIDRLANANTKERINAGVQYASIMERDPPPPLVIQDGVGPLLPRGIEVIGNAAQLDRDPG